MKWIWLLMLAVAFSGNVFAEDKPEKHGDERNPAPRRPEPESGRRNPYTHDREVPASEAQLTALVHFVRAEFAPETSEDDVKREIEGTFTILHSVEQNRENAFRELVKAMLQKFQKKMQTRALGRIEGVERVFRAAGRNAHNARQLNLRGNNDLARNIENYYEMLRATAYLVLQEHGVADNVDTEPFTRIERERISPQEAQYRRLFVDAYRKARQAPN